MVLYIMLMLLTRRFVYLEDCKHCIEWNGLEYYMNHEVEEGEVSAKCCPRCKTLIRQSKRYGNILRSRLKDVMAVKRKVFGNELAVTQKQNLLLKDITDVQWYVYLPEVREFLQNKLSQTTTNLVTKGMIEKTKLRKVGIRDSNCIYICM